MRASAAIAAMVVKAPMRTSPSAPQCIPVVSGAAARSISGPVETPLRRRLGQVGAGGAEFGAAWRSWLSLSCGGPPFERGDQPVGTDRNFGQPDADRVAMALASAGEVGTVATSPMPTLPPST